MQNQLGKIQHVVHLMLENRSFDQMLGYLYPATERPRQGHAFSGLTGEESNPDESGRPVAVGKLNTASAHLYRGAPAPIPARVSTTPICNSSRRCTRRALPARATRASS